MPNVKIGPKNDNEKTILQRVINKTIWLIGTARNAIIVVIGGSIAAYFFNNGHEDMFIIIGDIPAGLPVVKMPPFSIPDIVNETTGEILQEGLGFSDMISEIGSGLIVIPLIALLENIAICKAFANGKTVDATQVILFIFI